MLVALNFQLSKSFTMSKCFVLNQFARFLVFNDFAVKLALFLLKCVYSDFRDVTSLTSHVHILVFVYAARVYLIVLSHQKNFP